MEEIYVSHNSGVVVNGGLMYINRSGESIMGLNHQREVRACGQTEAQAIYPCCPSSPTNAQRKKRKGREGSESERAGALSAAPKNLHESTERWGIFLFFSPQLYLEAFLPVFSLHPTCTALYFGICGLEGSQVSLISGLGTVCSWPHICERS